MISFSLYKKNRSVIIGDFFARVSLLLAFIFILRMWELFNHSITEQLNDRFVFFVGQALLSDFVFVFYLSGIFIFFHSLVSLASLKWANVCLSVFCIFIVLIHIVLIGYFASALNPLGADVFGYTLDEIKLTIGAAANFEMFVVAFISVLTTTAIFLFLPRFIKISGVAAYALVLISWLCLIFTGIGLNYNDQDFGTEFANNLKKNKSAYFYTSSFYYFTGITEKRPLELYADSYIGRIWSANNDMANQFLYVAPEKFPFLHADQSSDVLSAHLLNKGRLPDIVILIIEGLGRAFSNSNAYMGSFTPFLDSLAVRSLYWENCLSTGGRTFAVLPSVLGSLPFGEHGFAEMGNNMPQHLSLLKVLKSNGYQSRFFYAGDAGFDNMDLFMKHQNIDEIVDKNDFDTSYSLLPGNAAGFSWGYGDFELYRRFFESLDKSNKVQSVNVILTVSTHSPFKLNNQQLYAAVFQKRLASLKISDEMKRMCQDNHQQLETVLYMDDALKSFFTDYSKRSSYQNTIFLITGDHRMPDIPLATKIDRYHVPLIIYSPQLVRPAKYPAVVSHFDITPSLLSFGKHTYQLKTPSLVCWMGAGLDSGSVFTNRNMYPLMPTKNGIDEVLSSTYFISNLSLYSVAPNLRMNVEKDENTFDQLNSEFTKFKERNARITNSKSLYPDSLMNKYGGKEQ